MKRILLFALSLVVILTFSLPVQAGFISDIKNKFQQVKIEKNSFKDIEALINKQDEYVSRYDLESLKGLYGDNFINNDGYTKELYFDLVKETWETYPDITYKTYIKDIKVRGSYATVETYETAVATTNADFDLIDAIGELYSTSNCRYHLEKLSDHWVITGEDVLDEYSTLRYGDARFIKMEFSAPALVSADKPYTATLKIDLPSDRIVIASINKENIVNPAPAPEEKFRRLPQEQILERMFVANADNLNEYNIASIGITQTESLSDDNIKVYMNGLAFIMTRVNVVPKNNFVKSGESNEQ